MSEPKVIEVTSTDTVFYKLKRYVALTLFVLTMLAFVASASTLWENVDSGTIVIIQQPVSGELNIYTEPGLKWQGFGKVTVYPKAGFYSFEQTIDPYNPTQERMSNALQAQSIKITFNDGGEAYISGSIRFNYPVENEKLALLHTRFGSHTAVLDGLIKPTVERSIYMSGPMMTSAESVMSRRAELPTLIEDQSANGLYRSKTKDVRIKDEFTGEERTIKLSEPVADPNSPNGIARQEKSVLSLYGVSLTNFTINNISYSEKVQRQVDKFQDLQAAVQTSSLKLRQAEQERRTAEEEGRANATKKEWEEKTRQAEEVTRAEKEAKIAIIEVERQRKVAVTEATARKEVAELDRVTAEQYKQAQILRGEGDAAYKSKVMAADGALEQKIAAWKYGVDKMATAISNYRGNWVPTVITGNAAGQSVNPAMDMLNLMSVKAAKDLALDLQPNKN